MYDYLFAYIKLICSQFCERPTHIGVIFHSQNLNHSPVFILNLATNCSSCNPVYTLLHAQVVPLNNSPFSSKLQYLNIQYKAVG